MRQHSRQTKGKLTQLGHLERDVLEKLSAGDLIYGFLLSARSTKRMYRLARERAAYRYRRKKAIEHLIEHRLISGRGEKLSITLSGRRALGILVSETRSKLGHSPWDGKWRIVTYDIPEQFAVLRRKVRTVLKRAGFVQLQQSLWIYPHEC